LQTQAGLLIRESTHPKRDMVVSTPPNVPYSSSAPPWRTSKARRAESERGVCA
jgi:hypothetical protein